MMNKKLLLSVLLTLLIAGHVQAKVKRYKRKSVRYLEQIKFGVQYRGNIVLLRESDPEEDNLVHEPSYRPAFDLFGEYALFNEMGVQFSLGYSGQGKRLKSTDRRRTGNRSYKARLYLHYFMFAAVPRFYPGNDRQFCLFIGPRISWLAAAKLQAVIDGAKQRKLDLLASESNGIGGTRGGLKRIDWGIVFGLDYESKNGIIIGLHYNTGLTHIFQEQRGENQVCTFSMGGTLGYNFTKLFSWN